jgi:glycerophosphoryl diester phosphodiesterase
MKTLFYVLLALLALDLLLTLAVRGRKGHPKWPLLRQYRYAHRGFHRKPEIPENSLPAFRRALERGWGAELDVHLLKDGTLAVMHDSSLRRTAGADVQLEDLTREELAQYRLEGTDNPVPLFDEVLALFEGKTPLIIELKTARGNHLALTKAVCERLDSYGGDFCIESFDPAAVRDLKKLRPGICRGQLSTNFLRDRNGLPWYKACIAANLFCNFLTVPDFIAYHFPDRDNFFLRTCVRDWGVQEVSWTIRSKKDLLEAEREGCIPIFERFDPDQDE